MLRNKIKILIAFLIIMIVVLIAGTSKAADYSCKVTLVPDKTEIKKGETVTILVKVSDINAGEGIILCMANLEWDKNVFSECNVTGDDKGEWTRTGFIDEKTLTMSREDLMPNSADQTIAKITLTAKADATIGEQTIKTTNIEFSTEEESFNVADASTTITIAENTSGEKPGENPGQNPGEQPGQTPTDTNKDTNNANKDQQNSGLVNTTNKLPNAGIKNILLISGIAIVAILGVVSYIRYKKIF